MGTRAYSVNITGLTNTIHHFDFEIGEAFFRQYGTGLVQEGRFTAQVTLDKRETFIEAGFLIKGTAGLICDRSLDPFQHPIEVNKKIVFKYGDAEEELSDEIVIINRDADRLELGQYMYEFIGLEVPIKKLHPRYQNEPEDEGEGKIIYSSGSQTSGNGPGDDDIDPRWEQLKKLK